MSSSKSRNTLQAIADLRRERLIFWSTWPLATLGCLIGMAELPRSEVSAVPTVLMVVAMLCLAIIAYEMMAESWELVAAAVFIVVASQVVIYGGFSTRPVIVATWSLILAAACILRREVNIKGRKKCLINKLGNSRYYRPEERHLLGPERVPLIDLLEGLPGLKQVFMRAAVIRHRLRRKWKLLKRQLHQHRQWLKLRLTRARRRLRRRSRR